MIWKFPLKIQTFDTRTLEKGFQNFETKEEFIQFMWDQFKLPGKYNLSNTKFWQEVGNTYDETRPKDMPNFEGGRYTTFIKGTFKYKEFWKNEKDKVLNGYIVDGIYIPPFYYNYLNFCPIYDAVQACKKLGNVWDGDLWFFSVYYVMYAPWKACCSS